MSPKVIQGRLLRTGAAIALWLPSHGLREESMVVFCGPRSSLERLLPAHRRLCKGWLRADKK